MSDGYSIQLPDEVIEAIATRVLELLEERGSFEPDDPWLTVEQAANYIAAKPQRLYDLRYRGELIPGRDGTRLLFRRSDLDRYLEGGSG
jgi:excisionase family DNA binding protein